MEDTQPQFDADGRDPELIAFWKATARHADMTFRLEDVPAGKSFADFWREYIAGANSVLECAERLKAYVERRAPVARFDRYLTPGQTFMRHMRQENRKRAHDAEQLGGIVDVGAVVRNYINEREAELGPDDEFIRFMKATLPTADIMPFPSRQVKGKE